MFLAPLGSRSVTTLLRKVSTVIILIWLAFGLAACTTFVKGGNEKANRPLSSAMLASLAKIGSSASEPMVIRVFKEEEQLEVWKRTKTGKYALLKTYAICAQSGSLGPKIKEGDYQSPEGFYNITPGLMNPNSAYYLAFNIGFPNKFDRALGRTGSNLMVHGDCKSVGCFAMTDAGIAEIYALARETFKGGNPSFQIQIMPYRMTSAKLGLSAANEHLDFWKNIKEGYDIFELTKTPPTWDVCEGKYIFNANNRAPLDALGACPAISRSPELMALRAADDAAIARYHAASDRKVAEADALKARSEAVNGAVSGFFGNIGNAFTGGAPVSTETAAITP